MAATTGVRKFSSRSSRACPSRLADSACAAVRHSRNSSMSAPAMKESGFPLIRTAALMDGSDSSRWKSAMNSFLTAREMMFRGALGRSKTTIPTPSSTVRLSALIERRWEMGGGRNRNRFSADVHLLSYQVPPTSHLPPPLSRSSFNHHRKPQPAGRTHGHQPELPPPPRKFVSECRRYARPRGPERMTGRNAATHHVQPGPIDLTNRLPDARASCPLVGIQSAQVRQHLGREGLVHFDEVDVLQRQPRPRERDGCREDRRHQQLLARIERGVGVRADVRERLHARSLCLFLA